MLDLTINTRNTAPVLIGLSSILGRDLGPAAVQDGPEVDLLWYESPAERDDRLVEVLHRWNAEGLEPNDIVVLARRSITASGLNEGSLGCPVHDLTTAEEPPGPDSLLFSTIHAFKGLEARGAILVDVDDLDDVEALRLWYVAGTRARLRLAVLMAAQVRTTFLSKARLAGIEFAHRSF